MPVGLIGCTRGAASTSISSEAREGRILTIKRMDNVLIVVDDLEAAKAFFIELGLKLEGETTVEGHWLGRHFRVNVRQNSYHSGAALLCFA